MSRPIDPRLASAAPALRRYLGLVTACQLFGALLMVAQAGLLAASVVEVFVHHDYGQPLVTRLVLLALVGVGRAVLGAAQEYLGARASVRVRAQLRRKALEAMVRMGPSWLQRQAPGRVVSATGPGLDSLDAYLTRAVPAVVGAAVVPAVILLRITFADWQSGLLLLLLLPLVPLFMALVGITTRRRVQRQYVLLARLAGHFLDLVRGLSTLRIYGQVDRQQQSLRKATEEYRTQTLSALRVGFLSSLVLDLVAALSVAVVAVDVGLRLDGGSLPFQTALVVLLLAPEVFAPLRSLGVQYHANVEGVTASAAVLSILDEAAAVPEIATGPAARADGRLVFHKLTIRHPGRELPAVAALDLTIEPGEVVALGGPSGAGKSTVLAAVLGFAPPDSGAVLAGSGQQLHDVASLDADGWRQNIAWLPQRPAPSQLTVADEVRLGDPAADDAALAAACRECRAPAPETALGEDGRWVSAGQRRRIALARVLLRVRAVERAGAVAIVLLDEPSEDLDRETELVVARVIDSLAGRATVLVATHSPTITATADRAVTMVAGSVGSVAAQLPARVRPDGQVQQQIAILPQPAPIMISKRPRTPLRLRELARGDGVRSTLALAGALAGLAGLAGLGLTTTSTWLISRAAEHPNVQALAIAVVGVRTFAISRALLRYAERLAAHDGALRLLANLRTRVFAAVWPMGPGVLAGYRRGDLLRRFVGDVDSVQDGIVRVFVPVCGAAVTALGAVLIAGGLAPVAGLTLLAGLLLGGVLVPWLTRHAAGDQGELAAAVGAREALSAAAVDALPELVAYGQADTAVDRIWSLDQRITDLSRRPASGAAGGVLLSAGAAALTLPLVVLAGASAIRAGRLSPVELAVLATCVLVGFDAVAPLPSAFSAWMRSQAALSRIAEVLGAAAGVAEPTIAAPAPSGPIGLGAHALQLAPALDAPLVLAGADLTLHPGQRIVVMGPSGCGKSTLLAAALRLLPVSGGSLWVTGAGQVELAQLSAESVPPLLAGSLQGDHVFDATLRDNLRVVRPAATDADLDAVARRAGLGDLIAALPQGWNTFAGTDGSSLSGGERQRLLLARALLADPSVLLLDEPTAHLDAATERAVLADLLDATAGRTVLMSTHRRMDADQVDFVLQLVGGLLVPEAGPDRVEVGASAMP